MTQDTHIPIQIDHKPYKASKALMTGAELRVLADPAIGSERDFFQEVPGPGDDIKIANETVVELKPGMHFYSAPATIDPGTNCETA